MSERKTMWIVSHGEYSRYAVDAICPDEATAQAVADRANQVCNLAEDDYDAFCIEEKAFVDDPAEVALLWVASTGGGSFPDSEGPAWRGWLWPFVGEGVTQESHPDDVARNRHWWVRAAARDPERARKIARDRAAELRAQQEGLT